MQKERNNDFISNWFVCEKGEISHVQVVIIHKINLKLIGRVGVFFVLRQLLCCYGLYRRCVMSIDKGYLIKIFLRVRCYFLYVSHCRYQSEFTEIHRFISSKFKLFPTEAHWCRMKYNI